MDQTLLLCKESLNPDNNWAINRWIAYVWSLICDLERCFFPSNPFIQYTWKCTQDNWKQKYNWLAQIDLVKTDLMKCSTWWNTQNKCGCFCCVLYSIKPASWFCLNSCFLRSWDPSATMMISHNTLQSFSRCFFQSYIQKKCWLKEKRLAWF